MLVEFNEAHRQDTAPPYCMATGVGIEEHKTTMEITVEENDELRRL
jgi:hypothetical protein